MKLQFRLLVIDDNPGSVSQAIEALRDHLYENGFDLATEEPPNVAVPTIGDLSRNRGKDFDLVAVDYLLGQDHFDGGDVASTIRRELQYTDMVFYSSNASLDLLGRLAKSKVQGVFVATREELGEALIGLAGTVIGKAVDLNHMRGIAMAEVAEMDLMMEDTLAYAFLSAKMALDETAQRTANRVRHYMTESSERVDKLVDEQGIVGLIRDARLFSSAHKYRTLKRVCNTMSPKPHMGMLGAYESEVIGKRNLLAHAKEVDDDGTTTLQSSRHGSTVMIDDQWMAEFRRTLRDQRSALEVVCGEIKSYYA